MKKSILSIGKTLNKTEQKSIYGGSEDSESPGGCYPPEVLCDGMCKPISFCGPYNQNEDRKE